MFINNINLSPVFIINKYALNVRALIKGYNIMINNNVNSQNFYDTIKSVQQFVQQINETLEKKAALPEELRKQQELLFNTSRQLLAYAISVNNDTPLNQIAPLFNSHKQCAEILKYFNFAVRRNSKTKQLKRTDYAKLDVNSVVNKVLEVTNPYSLAAIAEQKEKTLS